MALQNIKQIKGATQGSVLFLGPNGVVSENNSQLYWDINNNTLGVGGKLDVYGTSSTTYLQVTDGATAGYILSSVDSIGNAIWSSPYSLVVSGGALIGATNGLSNYGGYVGLGGTISQTTIINGDGYDLSLTNFEYILVTSSVFDVESDFISLDAGTGSVQILAGSDIVIDTLDQLLLSANSALVSIGNTQGLVYDGDYTTGFVTYSLITKGYVDSLILLPEAS